MGEFTSAYWNDRAAAIWSIRDGMKDPAARDALLQVVIGYTALARIAEKRERAARLDITTARLRSETDAAGEGGSRRMG